MSFNDFLGSWIPGSPLKLRPSQLKYMYSVFYCLLCVILVILSLLNIISTKSLLSLSLSVYIALAIIPTGQADLLNSPIPAPSWSSSCNITTNEGLNESHTDPNPLVHMSQMQIWLLLHHHMCSVRWQCKANWIECWVWTVGNFQEIGNRNVGFAKI